MAKNAELFNNLCNFMKYFLNEVLPENDPNDLILDSVKELFLALIKYTKLINYDISTIVQIDGNNCNYFNADAQHQISCNKSQPHAKEIVSNSLANLRDSLDKNKSEINIKESGFSGNEPLPKINNHEALITRRSDENNKFNADPINVPDGRPNFFSDEEGSFDEEVSTDSESNSDIAKNEASNEENHSPLHNNAILNKTFLIDSDSSKRKVADSKSGSSEKEEQISEKLQKIKLSHQTSGRPRTDIIPLEYIEVNRCLMEKLISTAYYCWECGFVVSNSDFLSFHVTKHNNSSENSSKGAILAVEICSECSFVAAVPQEVTEQLIKYHMNFFHKLNSVKDNTAAHLDLVKSTLKKKFNKEVILPHFIGICLLCNVVFETPLEWNSHICELLHLQTHLENIVSCSRCCIVILGLTQELSVQNYLGISDHVNFCQAIKYNSSNLKKF